MLVFYYYIGKKTAHSGVVKKSRTEHFCSIRLGTGGFEELPKKLEKLQNVNVANDDMTPIFMATIEATEEAVVNSLFKAKDVKGYNGKVTKALPVDQVLEMLKAEGKIVKQPR